MPAISKQSAQHASLTVPVEISRGLSTHHGGAARRILVGGAGAVAVFAAMALAALSHPKLGEIPKAGDMVWLASLAGVYASGCFAFFAALERFDTKRALGKTAVAVACVLVALVLLYAIALLVALIGSVISGALESLGSRDSDDSDSSGESKSDGWSPAGYHGGFTFGSSSESTPPPGSGRGHSTADHSRCPGCGDLFDGRTLPGLQSSLAFLARGRSIRAERRFE